MAKNTLRVSFDLMGQKVNFKAGQYIFITIPNMPYTDERGNRRHFTISSPPGNDISITTRIRPSAFKRWLAEASAGSEVELGMIDGEFTLPGDTNKRLVFLAGGIGITPYISMLEHIKNAELPYKVSLIYSNKNQESTAYLKEVKKWAKEIPGFKLILIMTGDSKWKGERKMIDSQLLKNYFTDLNDYTFYISGPPAFVESIRKTLDEAGVKGGNIKLDRFTGY